MTRRHAVVLVLCLVTAAMVGLPAAAQETPTDTPTGDTTTNDTADRAGLGTQLTAFLQSSSAAANDTVENGMWQAGFERANESQRARLVTSRTGALAQRLDRLEARNESLRDRYENGTISEQAYVAQQSRLSARIDALRTAVNDTDAAASTAGVEDARLETLKRNASRLKGPDVSAIARGLAGGPPVDPPGQAGERPAGNETTAGPSDTDRGPAGDREDPRNAGGANASANGSSDGGAGTGQGSPAEPGDGGADEPGEPGEPGDGGAGERPADGESAPGQP